MKQGKIAESVLKRSVFKQLHLKREPFYKGMNSKIKMTRTRTLMQDGKCCDFVFDLEE